MSFQEYLNRVITAKREHPEWRLGQTYFNVLQECNPRLAKRISDTDRDPFYNDERVKDFISYVHDKWTVDKAA